MSKAPYKIIGQKWKSSYQEDADTIREAIYSCVNAINRNYFCPTAIIDRDGATVMDHDRIRVSFYKLSDLI